MRTERQGALSAVVPRDGRRSRMRALALPPLGDEHIADGERKQSDPPQTRQPYEANGRTQKGEVPKFIGLIPPLQG